MGDDCLGGDDDAIARRLARNRAVSIGLDLAAPLGNLARVFLRECRALTIMTKTFF